MTLLFFGWMENKWLVSFKLSVNLFCMSHFWTFLSSSLIVFCKEFFCQLAAYCNHPLLFSLRFFCLRLCIACINCSSRFIQSFLRMKTLLSETFKLSFKYCLLQLFWIWLMTHMRTHIGTRMYLSVFDEMFEYIYSELRLLKFQYSATKRYVQLWSGYVHV